MTECHQDTEKSVSDPNSPDSPDDTSKTREDTASPSSKPNLARWFWGTILAMAVLSIVLSLMASINQRSDGGEPPANTPAANSDTTTEEKLPTEATASQLDALFDAANSAALQAVSRQIDPLLGDAYAPAYGQIPNYADFHYSVVGEYSELLMAAGGNAGAILEEKMFEGLDARIQHVGNRLDELFSSAFLSAISIGGETGGFGLGPLTEQAISNATQRMAITVPIGAATIVGTKMIAATIAQKVAAKLAAKAAAKTGGKWISVLSGLGGGTLMCSWSGPAAPVCGIAGGIIAWVATDYGIVKLDEMWNRDEFETELRTMIDEQKAQHRAALETAIMSRALAVQEQLQAIVEQQDFTLRELAGVGNSGVCQLADDLIAQYYQMNEGLFERKPNMTRLLRSAASEQAGNLSLGRLAGEILENLKDVSQLRVASVRIIGNLPMGQRADREVSGTLLLASQQLELPLTPATEVEGFLIDLAPNVIIRGDMHLNYSVNLEQHLYIRGNRHFKAQGNVDLAKEFIEGGGLEQIFNFDAHLVFGEVGTTEGNQAENGAEGKNISLALTVLAQPLPDLQRIPKCH